MLTFFNPWRRKIGVVTLVMACAFMCVWIRSNHKYDRFGVYRNRGSAQFYSAFGRIIVTTSKAFYENDVVYGSRDISEWQGYDSRKRTPGASLDPFNNAEFISRADWAGVHYGVAVRSNARTYAIPDWFIELPLTLLSAYLLLSKPRPEKNPPDDTKPTENDPKNF